jgi:hypothetical protein
MSIAEKLQTIAENEQRVYDAGYDKGYISGEDSGYTHGIEQGKQAEREEFWHDVWYEEDGSLRKNFVNGFSGSSWNEKTFKPIYPPEKITTATGGGCKGMFYYFNRNTRFNNSPIDMTDFCKHFSFENCTDLTSLFQDARAENIDIDLSNCTNATNLFNMGNGGSVDNVRIKITDKCTNFTSAFASASSLKTLIFTEDSIIAQTIDLKYSPLSKESIVNTINTLSTETTTKTLTLKKTEVQNAFGTDYDSSTEWTTLKNSKSNWTITLK